jgi:hypothetical protein
MNTNLGVVRWKVFDLLLTVGHVRPLLQVSEVSESVATFEKRDCLDSLSLSLHFGQLLVETLVRFLHASLGA